MKDVVEQYNGWKNRETWLVNSWLNNDEISYRYLMAVIRDNDPPKSARIVNEYFDELLEDSTIPLWMDLMREVLSKVDWTELVLSQ